MYECLLPNYLEEYAEQGDVAIAKMSALIKRGEIDGALSLLSDFLKTVPYCDNTNYEGHYQQMLYIIFVLLTNYNIQVEQHTGNGRIDISMETADLVYIVELKFGKSPEKALKQIEIKQYTDAFRMKDKKIVKVGVNFTVKDGINNIEWKVSDKE